MDIFQELGRQTAKIVANLTGAMDELSSLANKSADNVSGIFRLKGQIESLKSDLRNAYREIGDKTVNEPETDLSEQIQKAKEIKAQLEASEAEMEAMQKQLKQDGRDTKDFIMNKTEKAVDTAKDEIDAKKDEIADYIETEVKDAENKIDEDADKVIQDLEKDDKTTVVYSVPKDSAPVIETTTETTTTTTKTTPLD